MSLCLQEALERLQLDRQQSEEEAVRARDALQEVLFSTRLSSSTFNSPLWQFRIGTR